MSWNEFFESIKKKEYYKTLEEFWDKEYSSHAVYPSRELIFNAFNLCELEDLKCVVIGQDPYHEVNQAMGLSFSVPKTTKLPPSLVNIYKEIEFEYGNKQINNGDLTYLAKQGVLLLNAYLTVREGEPLSHAINEYKLFIQDVIYYIESINKPIVYMLWGTFAKKYKKHIGNPLHLVIEANHPSPLSANRGGWFHSNCFLKCDEFLELNNIEKINWKNN